MIPVMVILVNMVILVIAGGLQRNLNLVLSIFRALILWSRVDGGIPSLAAAPAGPETRPLDSASAASMISRSLRGSASALRGAGV